MRRKLAFLLIIIALSFGGCVSGMTPAYAAISAGQAIVSTAELKSAIDSDDADLIIIGVINPAVSNVVPYKDATTPVPRTYLVWRDDYSGDGSTEAISPVITGYRKSKSDMEALLSKAGVSTASKIVVYSENNMNDSARFVWQLRILGLTNVSYLDGGMNAWKTAGYSWGDGVRLNAEAATTNFIAPNYDPDKFDASLQFTADALKKPGEWVVIDARTPDEYNGLITASSNGAYGIGRMKGAVNIEWTNALDSSTRLLKSKSELEAIYSAAIGKKVIIHCQTGVRSAHTYFALKEVVGVAEVYNYDGSWIEWSYAASRANGDLYEDILDLTEVWEDNRKPLQNDDTEPREVSITMSGKTYEAVLQEDGSYLITLPKKTNVSALEVYFYLPLGASVSPANGSPQDFTSGSVLYSITSANGTMDNYIVAVELFSHSGGGCNAGFFVIVLFGIAPIVRRRKFVIRK
ncbi:MAG: rhodanese-like domain-containing protein [Synergistaceae bacterium]|nr:rhodanese-like domain-containing protein [Synergistaceae bacterium]